LRNLVSQQLTLSEEDRKAAQATLDRLFTELTSSTSTTESFKAARDHLAGTFPWLAEPVKTLLNTPAALQMLGQIATRSM
jgi:hypothetical protein